MRKALLAGALLVVCSMVLGATVLREPIAHAATPFQNVLVMNSDTQPLPVKAPQPLPVREQAHLQPVQVSQFGSFPTGDRFSSEETLYTDPAGKTLVIESFSTGSAMGPNAVMKDATLDVELNGFLSGSRWNLIPTDEGVFSQSGARVFRGSTLMRAYAGPGTDVVASARRDGADGDLSGTAVSFEISGYLVATP